MQEQEIKEDESVKNLETDANDGAPKKEKKERTRIARKVAEKVVPAKKTKENVDAENKQSAPHKKAEIQQSVIQEEVAKVVEEKTHEETHVEPSRESVADIIHAIEQNDEVALPEEKKIDFNIDLDGVILGEGVWR